MNSREVVPLIPFRARDEFLELAAALRQRGPAPCERASAADWWPERFTDDEQAVQACRACPVRGECLAYAVAARERYGIWGATRPEERA